MAKDFQANAEMLQIRFNQVPIEATNHMSLVERYQERLSRAFPE